MQSNLTQVQVACIVYRACRGCLRPGTKELLRKVALSKRWVETIKFELAVAFSSHGRRPPSVSLPGLAGLDLAISSRGSRFLRACTSLTRNASLHPSMLEFSFDPHHITQYHRSKPSQASGSLPYRYLCGWL